MKKTHIWLTLLLLSFFTALGAQAQHLHRTCGTKAINDQYHQAHPELASGLEVQRQITDVVNGLKNARVAGGVLKIPVVVHIIHDPSNTTPGTGDNISDAQVNSQIQVLNEDFRRQIGTRGFNTDAEGADTEIEFVLAKRDPMGAATTGIMRYDVTTVSSAASTTNAVSDNTIENEI
ncbi:MAG: Ulilysin, partial [Bacteroidota bacterium]